MRLKGKVAAITGAGSGIGRAAAELFAREGAAVAVLEIDRRTGEHTERAIRAAGGVARFYHTDIADPRAVAEAFLSIEENFGALHVLYNNASVFAGREDARVDQCPLEVWNHILGVNLNGLFHCSKYGVPLIIRSGGGSVINTASTAGLIGVPDCDAYTASKGATISLTRSMAVEYGQRKVRVNCLAPAAVWTAMLQESNLDTRHFDAEGFLRSVPLGRLGLPEEIANIALFLASDESSYLNGAIIVADGGITVTSQTVAFTSEKKT